VIDGKRKETDRQKYKPTDRYTDRTTETDRQRQIDRGFKKFQV